MALRTPPSWLQNGSHPAENDRLTMQGIVSATGTLGASSLAPTQNGTPNMSVNIAAGWAAIVGTYQSNMGVYMVYNDASVNATIATANATNPRIDLVCLTIADSFYTGATNTVSLTVVTGTPSVSPVVPTTPTNAIVLAQIAVGAAVTSILTANITDRRVAATSNLTSSSYIAFNTQTGTTYTTTLPDAFKVITLNNAGTIAVTIPPASSVAYIAGTELHFSQYGAGQVTISGGAGVTIYSTGATSTAPKLRTTYSAATAVLSPTTNTWLVTGDIV